MAAAKRWGPSGRGAGVGLWSCWGFKIELSTKSISFDLKILLHLSSLIIIICILLGGQNGQFRTVNLAGLERPNWPFSLDVVFSKTKP